MRVMQVRPAARIKALFCISLQGMCAAIEEMKMDSRTEGRKEGKMDGKIEGSVETYREVGYSIKDTIKRVAEKFSLSLQRSEEKVRKYWK